MSNENTVTVESTVSAAPAAAPKRTLNEASMFRLEYERNQLTQKSARLGVLKEGTPGYKRCQESIEKTQSLIASIEKKMSARMEKARAKAAANQNVAAPAAAVEAEQRSA